MVIVDLLGLFQWDPVAGPVVGLYSGQHNFQ